jgi:hypothetical protein
MMSCNRLVEKYRTFILERMALSTRFYIVETAKWCWVKDRGQRHTWSGANFLKRAGVFIPISHVLVYAPRNKGEIKVAMAIVKASIQYMSESRDQLEEMSSSWRSGDPRAWFT